MVASYWSSITIILKMHGYIKVKLLTCLAVRTAKEACGLSASDSYQNGHSMKIYLTYNKQKTSNSITIPVIIMASSN